jgi:hypothetical protein
MTNSNSPSADTRAIALTKEPRQARQFRNRKEAADFAASVGWQRNDARRIEIMGFLLWAVCDEHMNYIARTSS